MEMVMKARGVFFKATEGEGKMPRDRFRQPICQILGQAGHALGGRVSRMPGCCFFFCLGVILIQSLRPQSTHLKHPIYLPG